MISSKLKKLAASKLSPVKRKNMIKKRLAKGLANKPKDVANISRFEDYGVKIAEVIEISKEIGYACRQEGKNVIFTKLSN